MKLRCCAVPLLALATVALVSACGTDTPGPAPEARAEVPSPQAVLEHHLTAFAARDREAILADYGPSSVLMTPQGVARGRDELGALFDGTLAEFAKPGATFALKRQSVRDEIAFVVWSAETADATYELATDTFVIRDGKIVAQTFAALITPKDAKGD